MNKFTKYGWWLLIIAPLLFTFGVYVNNGYETTNEEATGEATKAKGIVKEVAETEIPEKQVISTCPDDYVDWDIAVTALSEYGRNQSPDYDLGPADIERHFAENCEEDLKIYNDYINKN